MQKDLNGRIPTPLLKVTPLSLDESQFEFWAHHFYVENIQFIDQSGIDSFIFNPFIISLKYISISYQVYQLESKSFIDILTEM